MFYKKQVKHVYVMGITVVILINSNSFFNDLLSIILFCSVFYTGLVLLYPPILIFSFV